jgi:signal transduction histidine kinase
VEGAAWFAVSELCANALKHSGAERLVITIREAGGRLQVTVADDGCGIPAQRAADGLRGLRDRVEALDGRLSVCSSAGTGTSVVVDLPARRARTVDA